MPRPYRKSIGPRWKLGQPDIVPRPLVVDDYRVELSTRQASLQHYAKLMTKRKTDKRVIFPFEGAAQPGPFPTAEAARKAGEELAHSLIAADIERPE